jgi:hypothetical protein
MAVIKEEISGTLIKNEIKSSNIKASIYDTEAKSMIVEFLNGAKYMYQDVPHQTYTKFRMAKSQGQFFSSDIAKKFKYTKI